MKSNPLVVGRGSDGSGPLHGAARQQAVPIARRNLHQCSRRTAWLAAFAFATVGVAVEVQQHGLVFEQWVRDSFFESYRPASYTQKWDIPADHNHAHGGVPVNPKAAKYGTPVDLGDALRQFDINEPFILVIGFWRQELAEKRFVNVIAPRIEPATWRRLWGDVTRADLERLDRMIKDRSLMPEQARLAAHRMKSAPPFDSAVIVLNPKIDSHEQRRLQCSLRFEDVFRYLAPSALRGAQEHPRLWEVELPTAVPSPRRAFDR
jgi:hypothetical protein